MTPPPGPVPSETEKPNRRRMAWAIFLSGQGIMVFLAVVGGEDLRKAIVSAQASLMSIVAGFYFTAKAAQTVVPAALGALGAGRGAAPPATTPTPASVPPAASAAASPPTPRTSSPPAPARDA